MPKELLVALLSMSPLGELRIGIPVGIAVYGLSPWSAFLWAFLGNALVVVLAVFFTHWFADFLSEHSKTFKHFFEKLCHYTHKKHSKSFEAFEDIALVIFVAIPLPLTGGLSGALASFVFNIPPRRAIPLILLGVFIAGIAVTLLTTGTRFFLNIF